MILDTCCSVGWKLKYDLFVHINCVKKYILCEHLHFLRNKVALPGIIFNGGNIYTYM